MSIKNYEKLSNGDLQKRYEFLTKEESTNFYTTSGTGTEYTVSVPYINELSDGVSIKIKFHTNSSANCYLNVNSLGKRRLMIDTSTVATTEFKAGSYCTLIYNSSISSSIAQNPGSVTGGWVLQYSITESALSVETTGSGNAVTSASYDVSTRKITLSKGTTFALAEKRAEITLTETELNNILASTVDNPCALTRTTTFYNQFTSDVKVLDVYYTYVEDEQPVTVFAQSLVRFEEMEGSFTFYGLTSPNIVAKKTLGTSIPSDRWVFSIELSTPACAVTYLPDKTGTQIIALEDNNTSTAGTWLAKTNEITSLVDGQFFLYKIPVAGSTTTTLNITANGVALGAKTIYRYGTTKLTTQYAVGQYLLLSYNSNNNCFRVVNDYDSDTNTKVRQYQAGTTARSGTQYSLLARYAVTDKAGSYDANYARYHTDTYLDTSTGYIYTPKIYINNEEATTKNYVDTGLSGKQNTLTTSSVNDGTLNKAIGFDASGNLVKGTAGSDISVETTYSALKTLRDNSQLVPGTWYRITDYTTTAAQANTSSAGHQFDIIVRADGVNKLNENAYAIQHAGDTYFANNDLSAWKLKYTIIKPKASIYSNSWGEMLYYSGEYEVNNVSYHGFGTIETNGVIMLLLEYELPVNHLPVYASEDGEEWLDGGDYGETVDVVTAYGSDFTGLIYHMIDEFDNECPYDFKNILFKRWNVTDSLERSGIHNKYMAHATSDLPSFLSVEDTTDFIWAYTFSSSASGGEQSDTSLLKSNNVRDNIIKSYEFLNNIVLFGNNCSNNTFGNDCHDNTFGDGCYNSTFGNNCIDNIFGNGCYKNTFGNQYHSNTFGDSCYSNTFGDDCSFNTFGNYCQSHTFSNNCSNNTFGNSCASNTFGNYCQSHTFSNNCRYNTFDDNCMNNIFGNNCSNNTFGSECRYNTFGNNYYDNTFGNNCQYTTFGNSSSTLDYCRNIKIDSGCGFLYINSTSSSSNYLQNVHIHLGVKGTLASNRKTVTIPDRNLPYETNVYMDENGNIEMVINSGGSGSSTAEAISYTTTAPTADNPTGIKFVILEQEPATRYNGYYYIITGGSGQIADEALTTSEINSMWSGS